MNEREKDRNREKDRFTKRGCKLRKRDRKKQSGTKYFSRKMP